MELREFVKTTIVEIAHGLKEAQNSLVDMDVMINPSRTTNDVIDAKWGKRKVQTIEFNIGLTIEDKGNNKKGIGIASSILNAGITNENSDTKTSATSVNFLVPISWPVSEVKYSQATIPI